jgi:hypothetical protein
MNWTYWTIKDGRLVDEDGDEGNTSWPSFETSEEANQYLEDNDIRGSIL